MSDIGTVNVLNRLITVVSRSLPAYLAQAAPFVEPGDERAAEVLANIQANQQGLITRLGNAIRERRARVEIDSFPMIYTDLNFLSLRRLLPELVKSQRRDIAIIESCARALAADPDARALAEEVLGSERAHLEQLEELLAEPVGV